MMLSSIVIELKANGDVVCKYVVIWFMRHGLFYYRLFLIIECRQKTCTRIRIITLNLTMHQVFHNLRGKNFSKFDIADLLQIFKNTKKGLSLKECRYCYHKIQIRNKLIMLDECCFLIL